MQNQSPSPITVGPREGQNISMAGDTYRILVTGKQTGNAFATIDMLIPPGGGPGPHAHLAFQETFYVVEGEIEVKSEAGTFLAKKGAYVVVPKGGLVHCFKNKSDQIAHLLCTVVPSGLEEMFLEIGLPVAAGEFLPAEPINSQSLRKMIPILEKYGQRVFPPDYLDH